MINKSGKGNIVILVTHAIFLYSLLIVLLIALLVIAGWIFDVAPLTRLLPGTIAMKFNTALSFFLLAAILLLSWFGKTKKHVTTFVVAIVLLHSLLVLSQFIFSFSARVDELFIKERNPLPEDLYPGRMSPITAFCFSLVCTGLLLQLSKRKIQHVTGQILMHVTSFIAFAAVLGYFTNTRELYTIGVYTSIALPSAILFFLVSVAGSMQYSNLGLVGLLTKDGIGNDMARRQVPAITAGIIVLTLFLFFLNRLQVIDEEFSISLLGLMSLTMMLLVIFGTVKTLNKLAVSKQQLEISLLQSITFIKDAPTAIAMFDREMRYMAVSDKWLTDYNITEKNIIGKSHYQIFPEISEEWKKVHQECLAGAVNKCDEALFRRNDGTLQWIAWVVRPWRKTDDTIGGLIILTNDLTTQKKQQLEKERFESILNQTSLLTEIGAWEVNVATREVRWSKSILEMLETESSSASDIETAIELYSEAENKKLIQEAFATIMEHGGSFNLETELLTQKRKKIPVRLIGHVEKNGDTVTQIYGVLQNLESIRRGERELKEALELTTDQNKRLKNFAQIVSHNLRSHSGNLNSLLQLLLKRKPELEGTELMQHVMSASEQLVETVNNLSDIVVMNSKTSEHFVQVNLGESIHKCIAALQYMADENRLRIINNVPADILINAVPAYVESIFTNLITNAVKYKRPDTDAYIEFAAENCNPFMLITVKDNGQGIDLEKSSNKLFGMYQTFHGNTDARGLGLFMSRNQLEAMGGRIDAESKPGEGTTFKLYFRYV